MNRERGAMLVELIIAMLILSVVAVSFSSAMTGSMSVESASQARNHLASSSEVLLEQVRTDTSWMRSGECEAVDSDQESCDINSVFHDTADLADERIGAITVEASATAIDSEDDGTGDDDEDDQPVDFFRVAMTLDFVDRDRVPESVEPLDVASTIAVPAQVGKGRLDLQVCRVRNQFDQRMTITNCDQEERPVMSPGLVNQSKGGESPYVCAHPDLYDSTWSDSAYGVRDSKDDYWSCRGARPPFVDTTTRPDYTALRSLGQWGWFRIQDRRPVYRPASETFPSDNRSKFVESIIEPVAGVTVTITHAATGDQATATTDTQGRIAFEDLVPGTYGVQASSSDLDDYDLSPTKSVPGLQLSVDEGVENKALYVYVPKADGSIAFTPRYVDVSFPWARSPDDQLTDFEWTRHAIGHEPGESDMYKSWDTSPLEWDPDWGPQTNSAGTGPASSYTTADGSNLAWRAAYGPGPWPYERDYRATNGLCLYLLPVPNGRLLFDEPPKACQSGSTAEDADNRIVFENLPPGLYTWDMTNNIDAGLWYVKNTPGFLWVDEDEDIVMAPEVYTQRCFNHLRLIAGRFDPSLVGASGEGCGGPAEIVPYDPGRGGGTS